MKVYHVLSGALKLYNYSLMSIVYINVISITSMTNNNFINIFICKLNQIIVVKIKKVG